MSRWQLIDDELPDPDPELTAAKLKYEGKTVTYNKKASCYDPAHVLANQAVVQIVVRGRHVAQQIRESLANKNLPTAVGVDDNKLYVVYTDFGYDRLEILDLVE